MAADLVTTRAELAEREVLLQDHLRLAYEQSQTSMLEVLLSTDSFGEGLQPAGLHAHPVGRGPPTGGRDPRDPRKRLAVRQQTLRDGQVTLTALRDAEKERTQALADAAAPG